MASYKYENRTSLYHFQSITHLTFVEDIAFVLIRVSCFMVLGICFSRGSSIWTMFRIISDLSAWWSCRAFDAVLTFTQSRVNHAPRCGQKQKINPLKWTCAYICSVLITYFALSCDTIFVVFVTLAIFRSGPFAIDFVKKVCFCVIVYVIYMMPPDNRYSILLQFHYSCVTTLLQFQSHLKYMRVRTVQRCPLLKFIECMWFTYLHEMLRDWWFFLISGRQLASFRFEIPMYVPEHRNEQQAYIYLSICAPVRP